jgi:chromate transporter
MIRSATEGDPLRAQAPSLRELFLAFSGVAIIGFGGVLPWARRMLVEERRWLSAEEFNEVYSLAQFLPGGNILNLAVVIGQRFHGPLGSLVSVVALLAGPVAIMTLLGFLYTRYGQIAAVHDALAGVAAAAAGLILVMAAKMAEPMLRRRAVLPLAIAVVAFVAVAVAELPLFMVLAVLVPVGIGLAWRGML